MPVLLSGQTQVRNRLQQFADKQHIEIEWKAFQLNPELQTNPDISIQLS